MALQVGGVNLPGVGTGPEEDIASPTKILCLTEVFFLLSFGLLFC